jgi:(p)ppGpp synthase/HD superfamily hydrolase
VHGEFKRVVNLRVKSDDRKGLLAKLSETFAAVGVNIVQANARANGDKGAISTFEIEIGDVKQLNDLTRAIGQIPGVHEVERI